MEEDEIKLEKFISEINENITKAKYRKSLEEIMTIEANIIPFHKKWRLVDLKIKCMLHIIKRKFTKYSHIPKVKGVSSWLNRVDFELENWFDNIRKNKTTLTKNKFYFQLELCIEVLLQQCYNYALYNRIENNIGDCAGYLAIGERLIKQILDGDFPITKGSIFGVIVQIMLFISSLMIADGNYETAKDYQQLALTSAEKELRMSLKDNPHDFDHVYINIVIAFYQMGVCEENLGNILKAIEAFKQSKWFSLNFLKHSMPLVTQLMCDIEHRAVGYFKLTNEIKEKINGYKESITNKSRNKPALYYSHDNPNEKFEKTLKFIESLKIPKFEEDDIALKTKEKVVSPKIKEITSTVKMLNNLMSVEFKDIVNSMEKIELTNIEKDTGDKIRKKMTQMKIKEKYKRNSSIDLARKPKEEHKAFYKTDGNIGTNPKPPVAKFNYSKDTFNKSYRKKINYLESYTAREYSFQKKLLSLKKYEKLVIPEVKQLQIKEECQIFFNKTLSTKLGALNEGAKLIKKKEVLDETFFKINKQKEKMETSAIKSLNGKVFEKFVEINKRSTSARRVTLRKEFMSDKEKSHLNEKTSDVQNVKEIIKVTEELNILNKQERMLTKKRIIQNK